MNDQRNKTLTDAVDMPPVSGSTDVYLILGDPVEQVLAPETFNPLFARFGYDAVLVPVQVSPKHLQTFVKAVFLAKSIKGLWITIPHKVPIMAALDHCSTLGQRAGAVNAVRRNPDGTLEGGLFDGEGLVNALNYHAYTSPTTKQNGYRCVAGLHVVIVDAWRGLPCIARSTPRNRRSC